MKWIIAVRVSASTTILVGLKCSASKDSDGFDFAFGSFLLATMSLNGADGAAVKEAEHFVI